MNNFKKQVGEMVYDDDNRFLRTIFNGCSILMIGSVLFCFAGAFFLDGYIDLTILRFLVASLMIVFIGNHFIRDDHQFCQHGIIKMKKGKPVSYFFIMNVTELNVAIILGDIGAELRTIILFIFSKIKEIKFS